jgi:lipoprotein-anchoring transpeptidase ErfK/SrfK
MRSRLLASIIIVAGMLAAAGASIAAPIYSTDPEERFTGGVPASKFGIWLIRRTTVSFAGPYKPGSIVVNTKERRLYYVLDGGAAIRYGIGVGRAGFTWGGVKTITAKKELPGWTPPPQMLARQPDLPRFIKGGDDDNPLGARAMYLGSTLYRIHGSNETDSIGEAQSSGCFRMTNDDVKDLYDRVKIGTVVHVLR